MKERGRAGDRVTRLQSVRPRRDSTPITGTRIRSSSSRYFGWLGILPAVSSEECIRVLESFGYQRSRQGEFVWVERDDHQLAIPISGLVHADVLVAVLEEANITPFEFIARLNESPA
jgi:hypothetical protein